MNEGFVGVHVGAGNHSYEKTKEYKKLCKLACKKTQMALRKRQTATEALVQAMQLLEDSDLTNAAFGSNLTEEGSVECDAGLMDGKQLLFGGVGAVSGVKNPIVLAKKLIDEQQLGLREYGRVPPSFLVGPAATSWACQSGIETCEPSKLISDGSVRLFKSFKRKIDAGITPRLVKHRKMEDNEALVQAEVSDTIGAVVCDQFGNVASATSSGGILFKQCGRVGQAAIYGCGCWAQCARDKDTVSIGISTSGCGEYLIRTHFAKECARYMQTRDGTAASCLKTFVEKEFIESPFLQNVPEKLAGAIVFMQDTRTNFGEFLWCHTTNSMCIGYMSTSDQIPTARMSRLPQNAKSGETIVVEGTTLNLALRKTTVATNV